MIRLSFKAFLFIAFLDAVLVAQVSAKPPSFSESAYTDTNDCPTPINGSLKGGPGNIQDHMFHSIAIDPKNDNIVYAGTETNGIFKTTDGGITWIRLRQGLKCTANHTGYPQIFNITVDPSNSQILYAATVNGPGPNSPQLYPSASGGVYRSTDGGLSWTQKNVGLPTTYATYVLVDSTNPQRIYVGLGGAKSTSSLAPGFYTGGVYSSTNSGDSWGPLQTPVGLDSNIYIDMTIRGPGLGTIYGSAQLHGSDASTAIGFFKSSDGGQTWSISNPPGQTIYAFDVFRKNPNIIYGHDLSQARKVHRSTDGGLSWTQLNAGFFSQLQIHPTDSLTIYFFGRNTINKSIDGLQTISTVYTDSSLDSSRQMVDIKISLSNPNVAWAAAKGYYLYRTTNAGATWMKITAIRDSVYAVTEVADEIGTRARSFALDQNFPNPFNGSTTIRFRVEREEHVELSVYDLGGRLVSKLISATLPPNFYQILWNGTDTSGDALPSGIYFYRMTAGNFFSSKKLTIIK